jgi:hypothetical protein
MLGRRLMALLKRWTSHNAKQKFFEGMFLQVDMPLA